MLVLMSVDVLANAKVYFAVDLMVHWKVFCWADHLDSVKAAAMVEK